MTAQLEDRCPHDMLIFGGRTTCATCRRLPDVPPIDELRDVAPLQIKTHRTGHYLDVRRRPDRLATFGKCGLCGEPITEPAFAKWSPDLADLVGVCCADTDD